MIRRGDIWLVGLSSEEHAQAGQPAGHRPAVVTSCDGFNQATGWSVTVIPGTTTRRQASYHLLVSSKLSGLGQATEFMPEQIITISRNRLIRRLGRLSPAETHRLSQLLAEYLDLAGY